MPPLRKSLRLALPLIASNLTVPLLGMVDTAVVGRLPDATGLGAVALGAAVMNLFLWVFAFLRTATGGLVAQAYGRRDAAALETTLARAVLIAVTCGMILAASRPAVTTLTIMFFDPGEALAQEAQGYLSIRLLGAPAQFVSFALIGYFLGQQRVHVPLTMLVVANGLNAALDVLFVLVWGMGVQGVAWATLIADYSGLSIGLAFLLAHRWRLGLPSVSRAAVLDLRPFRRYLALARDIVLRTAMLQLAFLTFTKLGVQQGGTLLAVNAVLLTFFTLQAHGLDGFSDAAEAMTGEAVGANDVRALRASVAAGMINGLWLALAISLCFLLAGGALVDLLTTIETVREAARPFLAYVAALPVLSVAAFVFDGVFFGATRGRELRNAMAVALAAYLALALTLPGAFGNHGLWLALLSFLVIRGLLLGWIFWRAERGALFLIKG